MGGEGFLSSLSLSSFLPAERRKNPTKLLHVFSRANSFLCSLSHDRGDTHSKTKAYVRRLKGALEYFILVGFVYVREITRSEDLPTRSQLTDAPL